MKTSLKFHEICSKHVFVKGIFLGFYFDRFVLCKWQKKITLAKKCWHDTMILLFTSAIMLAFSKCQIELERLISWAHEINLHLFSWSNKSQATSLQLKVQKFVSQERIGVKESDEAKEQFSKVISNLTIS